MIVPIWLANVVECALDRPVVARDQILRAHSDDGLAFDNDMAWRWKRPFTVHAFMNYFVTQDTRGTLWFRSSESYADGWSATLFGGNRVVRARTLGLNDIAAPVWVGNRMFALVSSATMGRTPAVATEGEGELRFQVLTWPELGALGSVDDLFVIQERGSFWGWASCGTDRRSIFCWTSDDGRVWRFAGPAVEPGTDEMIANNPCVVPIAEGRFRMYYRASHNPAVGSRIVSALSDDLRHWTREEGDRIRPGGRWDTHGVGFPMAIRQHTGWTLYYTGFWGACSDGDQCAQEWLRRVPAGRITSQCTF